MSFDLFTNSPIFLAVLEIRFNDENLNDIANYSNFSNEVTRIFPNSSKTITSNLKLENIFEGQTTVSLQNRKIDCFLYSSEDKLKEFTISLNKFNYKQSGKYNNFDDFTQDIKKVWQIHHPLLKNIKIKGISLRFFNKIEIHEEVQNPTDYFNISIQASQEVIKDVDKIINYSIRYITRIPEKNIHNIIALSLEETKYNYYPFILDIDVHDDNQMNNDLNLIWDKFESLRIEKDNLFNALLTEKTKNLYL